MITYFKMKYNEIKVKAVFYEVLANIINGQKDILDFAKKLYIALKDVPVDELRAELIKNIAEIVHNENNNIK